MANNIAFIPIRSGSVGIPNKNIKDFCGKPLIYWTTKAASDCELIDVVFVAVDCDEYEKIIMNFNLPNVYVYRRDFQNAQSNSTTEDVLIEFINKSLYFDQDKIVLMQATNPLIMSYQLNKAILSFQQGNCNSMLSCSEFKRFIWGLDKNNNAYSYNYHPQY